MQDRANPAAANSAEPTQRETPRGFLFALSAYTIWGFLPLYMKAVDHIPAAEVVAHRVLWSVPIAGLVLLVLGRTADIRAAFREPRTLLMAALTASIITVNWGVYVWAIAAERTVETALGYYINPLVSVFLGAVLLGERLSRLQVVSVGLAALAVLVLTVDAGGLPWVSLVLAFSFAAYGYLRKTLPVGPSQGFFLEVLILSVPCLGWVLWLETTGQGHFFTDEGGNIALLLSAGLVTAIPLILYAFGAKLLRISTIGLMQYIAPTLIAMMAVFVFGEPFGLSRMIAFGLIGMALVLYTWSMFSGRKDATGDR